MDFDRVQAEWVLKRFPKEQLPEVAAQALMAGFEGPFILDLVGYAAPSLDRLTPQVVEGAFQEMGRPPITIVQALRRLAREEARKVLRKETAFMSFAGEIWGLLERLNYDDVPDELKGLLELPSDAKDWVRGYHDQQVIELAWALVEES